MVSLFMGVKGPSNWVENLLAQNRSNIAVNFNKIELPAKGIDFNLFFHSEIEIAIFLFDKLVKRILVGIGQNAFEKI